MIICKTKDINLISKAINNAFDGDNELFDKWHLINGNASLAIQDTIDRCLDICNELKSKLHSDVVDEFYELKEGGTTIGYIHTIKQLSILHSFGLNINYRDSAHISQFVEFINRLFADSDFINCLLWEKNQRAIGFLERNGFEMIDNRYFNDEHGQYIVTLVKNQLVCQH